jgi:hypothetical protein
MNVGDRVTIANDCSAAALRGFSGVIKEINTSRPDEYYTHKVSLDDGQHDVTDTVSDWWFNAEELKPTA